VFERQALPRRAELWVGLEFRHRTNILQGVKEAAVAQIDLGRFAYALAEVLSPGRQGSDHEGAGQNVEVMLGGLVVDAEGAGNFRGIPSLPVVVGNHEPEPAQLFGGNGNAQLWNVTGKEGANELLAPMEAGVIGDAQE